jgi:hypothetical protein
LCFGHCQRAQNHRNELCFSHLPVGMHHGASSKCNASHYNISAITYTYEPNRNIVCFNHLPVGMHHGASSNCNASHYKISTIAYTSQCIVFQQVELGGCTMVHPYWHR